MTPTGSNKVPTLLQLVAAASAVDVYVTNFLPNNAVSVSTSGGTEHFINMQNGSYVAPPGSADVLSSNSTGFVLTDKHRNVTQFDAAGNMKTWTSPAGPVVTVSYEDVSTGEVPQTITNNMGRQLNFTWSQGGFLVSR